MLEPEVASAMLTVCGAVYVPVLGEITGVAVVGWPLKFDTNVQFKMSWIDE